VCNDQDMSASPACPPPIPDRGWAAISSAGASAPDLVAALIGLRLDAQVTAPLTSLQIAAWGLDEELTKGDALLLSLAPRRRERLQSSGAVRQALVAFDHAALREFGPTFAAAALPPDARLVVAADPLGFRQLYLARGAGWSMVTTSVRVAARCVRGELDGELDMDGLAVQSLLGWQLGQRTLHRGVDKLPAGDCLTLQNGSSVVTHVGPISAGRLSLDAAVAKAAQLLRDWMGAFLDEDPDAGLQLTGGQDSRLLLSAIPRARRRGLRVVTLGQPGDADVNIAADIATRFGMEHELLSLGGLEDLSPQYAHELCLAAANRLNVTSDPLAFAALSFAESRAVPGTRVSGLGGEVARGFYYMGRDAGGVSRARARRLAQWRMFANEAIPANALEQEFVAFALGSAHASVYEALLEGGPGWFDATDQLYLGHRMQRWAGTTESAVCLERVVVNPMLDDRFVAIAGALPPCAKRGARFLSRLQLALDEELGALPLDGRPAPAAYARGGVVNQMHTIQATARRFQRKAVQRLRGQTLPPKGGQILAEKLAQHWREDPATLEAVGRTGIFREEWLASVADGREQPSPSAAAFVVNVRSALVDR
jgi:asparagine synthase (glutamine-hydrolysing)